MTSLDTECSCLHFKINISQFGRGLNRNIYLLFDYRQGVLVFILYCVWREFNNRVYLFLLFESTLICFGRSLDNECTCFLGIRMIELIKYYETLSVFRTKRKQNNTFNSVYFKYFCHWQARTQLCFSYILNSSPTHHASQPPTQLGKYLRLGISN